LVKDDSGGRKASILDILVRELLETLLVELAFQGFEDGSELQDKNVVIITSTSEVDGVCQDTEGGCGDDESFEKTHGRRRNAKGKKKKKKTSCDDV
jgi:hypothetical protein